MKNPEPLISKDFMRRAAILRHFEKQRVSTQNRIFALTHFPRRKDWGMRLPDDHPDVVYFRSLLEQVQAAEDEHIEGLSGAYILTSLHDWTSQLKGLAPGKLMARFLGETGDPYLQSSGHDVNGNPVTEPVIRKFGSLKRYVGMDPDEATGRLPMPKSGEQAGYKSSARVRLWLITDQLIKQHDPTYHPIFTEGLERYGDEKYRGVTRSGKPQSDAQLGVLQRKRARILVQKTFLSDLYDEAKRLHEEG